MRLNIIVALVRLSYFVVGLTNNDPNTSPPVYKQYYHIQYNGLVQPSATASVSFPPNDDSFRYVIIQRQITSFEALCVVEVKVFLRGMRGTYLAVLSP